MWLSRIPEQPVDSIFLQYIIFSWARLLYFNTHTHKHTHVIPSVFGIKRARLDQPQSPRLDQVAQPETMKPNITAAQEMHMAENMKDKWPQDQSINHLE